MSTISSNEFYNPNHHQNPYKFENFTILKVSKKVPDLDSPMIRATDTPKYIGVSPSTYYNFRDSNSKYFKEDFPEIHVIGDNSKSHYLHEIDAWLESRKRVSKEKGKGGAK